MRQSINVMFTPDVDGLIPFKPSDDLPPKYYTAIQTWTLCFLTALGSRALDEDYGTTFIQRIQQGKLSTRDDVHIAFDSATTRCYAYCEADSLGDIYVMDARISDMDIDNIDGDLRLIIYVAFTFSDGTQTRINLGVS